MWTPKWRLALPLALATILVTGNARAGSVRDEAGMFSKDAISKANAEIAKIGRDLKLDVTIETVPSLNGEAVGDLARERARSSGETGVFVLLAKKESKISILFSSEAYRRALDPREAAIRRAFTDEFKKKDYDAGLVNGVNKIGVEASGALANIAVRKGQGQGAAPGRAVVRRGRGGSGLGTLLWIGLGIVVVMFIIRLIGSLFGGGQQYGPAGRMGAPGYGGGYGGGMGGGGGFMSSLFGGIGGAIAGNWLYDQFSGRHGGSYGADTTGGIDTPATDAWGNDPNAGADWGGGGTGDWGGGGGDTGGGGGDWGGGGGGDWGGGGGGGDW